MQACASYSAAQGGFTTKRRTILQLAGATLVAPSIAVAQAHKVHRLGWLSVGSESGDKPRIEGTFIPGMAKLGYEVGRNLTVDIRYANGDAGRLPALAAELIALKPDVLLGNGDCSRAMKAKTSRIPIVLTSSLDPVGQGLVKSLARPGTNVTGMSSQFESMLIKQIDLLGELVPALDRVALLNDASFAGRDIYTRVARETARAKRLKLLVIEAVPSPDGIRAAFAQIEKQQALGVVVGGTAPFVFVGHAIADEASRRRIPVIYNLALYMERGGLISYGVNVLESMRSELPPIVDRILRGANPAEIPVQQSATFELVINLKAAREIGLTIPQTVLFRADRVIE